MSLTEAEHRAMQLTADLMNVYAREIVADGPTRDQDVAEFAVRIHSVQHMLMAQSAARQHPDLYRLAGGVVGPAGGVPTEKEAAMSEWTSHQERMGDAEADAAQSHAPSGSELITGERQRQIDAEGWTPEHDALHTGAELVDAALCYLTPAADTVYGGVKIGNGRGFTEVPARWPWAARFWKPTPDDRVRELVKAGALVAAEIDRLLAGPQLEL